MRARYLFIVIIAVLMTGCNLQSAALTPTLNPNLDISPTMLPVTPIVQPTEPRPMLQATPTQFNPANIPVVATQAGIPTAISLPGQATVTPLNGVPTISGVGAASRYPIRGKPGQTIGINYTMEVLTGSVTLIFQGAEGILWQKTFTASETSRVEVTVERGGDYEVLAFIERFDGSYNLSWD
jgi:hypothetical protein